MRNHHLRLTALLILGLCACGGSDDPDPLASFVAAADIVSVTADNAAGADAGNPPAMQITPLTMRIDNTPIPVFGSDGRFHVVYELELGNATGEVVGLDRLDVLDARSGAVVASYDAAQIATRLVVRSAAAVPASLGAAQWGLVYLHLAFDGEDAIPRRLGHRIAARIGATQVLQTAAVMGLAAPTEFVIDAPLRGARYIAGDGCCEVIRHMRASLALNGRLYTAQRYAIDWEQLDEQGRIYVGDPALPASYVIYGKPAYAVADARVVAAVDGLPDTPPGGFPEGIAIEQADGNHVVLDLGNGRYALYAHFKPGSVKVRPGEFVRRGQVLGEVGTSGNSSEPHLHFQLTDGPLPLVSNGVPHRLRSFTSTRRGVSTAAFDKAIVDGLPIAVEPVVGNAQRADALALDLWIVDFPE